VAEICGERGDVGVDVGAGLVPLQQHADREGVAVMPTSA